MSCWYILVHAWIPETQKLPSWWYIIWHKLWFCCVCLHIILLRHALWTEKQFLYPKCTPGNIQNSALYDIWSFLTNFVNIHQSGWWSKPSPNCPHLFIVQPTQKIRWKYVPNVCDVVNRKPTTVQKRSSVVAKVIWLRWNTLVSLSHKHQSSVREWQKDFFAADEASFKYKSHKWYHRFFSYVV